MNKRNTKRLLLEWAIYLCIAAPAMFLAHAFRVWGSWLAFFGLILLVGTLMSLMYYGMYHAAREMALDGEGEPEDATKPK